MICGGNFGLESQHGWGTCADHTSRSSTEWAPAPWITIIIITIIIIIIIINNASMVLW